MLIPVLLTVLLTAMVMPGARAEPSDPALTVFASVLPIQTFVERIGGERVNARVMAQPGHSPATYDPTPGQVAALAKADLYVRVGVPFEDAWMPRIRSASSDMAILDLRDGLPLREIEAHDHQEGTDEPDGAYDSGHDHDAEAEAHAHGEGMDPHIWTSPPLVRRMAVAIRDRLSALDPAGADTYAANQAAFDAELVDLHTELKAILAELDQRRFLVYHPAWGYFADTYGLEQIPIEREGKSPGPRRLDALIKQARETNTRIIFVQPQFDQRAARQVARAIDGRVETADPLAADYAENLRHFARMIAAADPGADGAEHDDAHDEHGQAHDAGVHRQHDAHVHGVARLDVALEGDLLLLELTNPAMNDVPLFDVFPGTERIGVQLITPSGQSASGQTSDRRRLEL